MNKIGFKHIHGLQNFRGCRLLYNVLYYYFLTKSYKHDICVFLQIKCKLVAWHPDVATQLCMASEDDHTPVIQLWDLRFATSPLKNLESHHRYGCYICLHVLMNRFFIQKIYSFLWRFVYCTGKIPGLSLCCCCFFNISFQYLNQMCCDSLDITCVVIILIGLPEN